MTTTVFLDRDGVLNERAPEGAYVTSWSGFRFRPGVPEALRLLGARGYRSVVVTNQRGVSRGLMTAEDVDEIHARMIDALAAEGAVVHSVHVCPHAEGACDCRKPGIGLFLRARDEDPGIDLRDAVMVGDSIRDLEAADRAGMPGYLICAGAECHATLERARVENIRVDGTAPSLLALVQTTFLERNGNRGASLERAAAP